MAITSMVIALVGLAFCGLLSPLAIIFGHIGLHQIRRTGQSGNGMAIAGLVIGYLSLLAILGLFVLPLVL